MKLIILKDRNNSKSEPKVRLVNDFGNNVCDNLDPDYAQLILKAVNGWDELQEKLRVSEQGSINICDKNKELTGQVDKLENDKKILMEAIETAKITLKDMRKMLK